MAQRVVRTKDELKEAIAIGAERIVARGALAEKLDTAMGLKNMSKWTIGMLAVSLAAAPVTGGLSMAAAVPIAKATKTDPALIIAIVFLGLVAVLHVCRDFKKTKFKGKKGDIEAELELERE